MFSFKDPVHQAVILQTVTFHFVGEATVASKKCKKKKH